MSKKKTTAFPKLKQWNDWKHSEPFPMFSSKKKPINASDDALQEQPTKPKLSPAQYAHLSSCPMQSTQQSTDYFLSPKTLSRALLLSQLK